MKEYIDVMLDTTKNDFVPTIKYIKRVLHHDAYGNYVLIHGLKATVSKRDGYYIITQYYNKHIF